jgi:hypothetical protein
LAEDCSHYHECDIHPPIGATPDHANAIVYPPWGNEYAPQGIINRPYIHPPWVLNGANDRNSVDVLLNLLVIHGRHTA